ncbi:MAG: 30S ribosomal protein S19 [Methanocalculaceae archaeon]|jgi:small subunit ribosomal protein S19|nr:30S ribosomal protein S19 [Methanocalculaceae archaeon]
MAKKTTKRMPKRREEYTYHGYNIEQLKAMSMEELLPIMPSTARRKVLRGFTRSEENVRAKIAANGVVRTHIRSMIVLPEMIGKNVAIYSGKEFVNVEIPVEGIFHYFGEFALTRKRVSHGSAGIGATRSSKYVPLK